MYQIVIKPSALKELQWFPQYIQLNIISIIESLSKKPNANWREEITWLYRQMAHKNWRLQITLHD